MAELRRVEFRTKAQIVCDELKRRIVSGALPPGARLPLKPLADEFDCSEIPVREAFRSLEAGGFVELVPHGGARVSELPVEELVELTEIRAILEPAATVEGAERLRDQELRQLDALLAEMEPLAEANEAERYGRLNRRFHAVIIDACPNRKLATLVHDLWDRAERGRLVYLKGAAFMAQSHRQHAEMVRLIRAEAFEALRELSQAHSRFGLDAVRELAAWSEPASATARGRR